MLDKVRGRGDHVERRIASWLRQIHDQTRSNRSAASCLGADSKADRRAAPGRRIDPGAGRAARAEASRNVTFEKELEEIEEVCQQERVSCFDYEEALNFYFASDREERAQLRSQPLPQRANH